jgi:Fic family protein
MTRHRRSSRTNQKGRTINQERFIRLNHSLLNTPAWNALTPQERSVLIETMRQFNGSNNGRIGLSSRQAAKECNINKDTANRAFKRLVELGFLKRTSEGSFHYKIRHSPTWEVTEFVVGNKAPTKEYRNWVPGKSLGPK